MSNYVKKVDFWPNLHEICGCHGNIKMVDIQLTYNIKISATDEWKATESFSPLEKIVLSKIWKNLTGMIGIHPICKSKG